MKLFKKVLALWPTYGNISQAKFVQIDFWKCIFRESYKVTHNVQFLLFKYEQQVYNHVYPGQHVYVKSKLNGRFCSFFLVDLYMFSNFLTALEIVLGCDISRPYTPVWPLVDTTEYGRIAEDNLCLLVKTYPNGTLSSHLCSLCPGDFIEVSKPQGSFECWTLKTNLILLAAGTGITPMVPIIWNALHSPIKM